MEEELFSIYEAVINTTSSELILFFVIVAVVSIPLYVVISKGNKEKRKHEKEQKEMEKEERQQVITVIKDVSSVISQNTAVTAAFKATLENSVGRIHMRIDESAKSTEKIANDVAQMNVVQQTMLENQRGMCNNISKLLIAVNGERV